MNRTEAENLVLDLRVAISELVEVAVKKSQVDLRKTKAENEVDRVMESILFKLLEGGKP